MVNVLDIRIESLVFSRKDAETQSLDDDGYSGFRSVSLGVLVRGGFSRKVAKSQSIAGDGFGLRSVSFSVLVGDVFTQRRRDAKH